MNRPQVVLSIYDHVANPHYGGGGAVVVQQIAERLARQFTVTVFCGSYRGSRNRTEAGVRYVFLPVGWAGPRAGQLLFTLLLPLVALVRRPAVWFESLTPPFSVSLLPLLSRAPVVALVQMLCGADMRRRYGLPFDVVERHGLRFYRRFVVLNEADEAAARKANPAATIERIPNGVDLPPDAEAGPGRDEHILFLGRIDVSQKGLDLLLEAAGSAPPLPVLIAGSGTRQEEERLRRLLPAGDRVRFVGRVIGAEKARVLRDCAFMVVPSRYETFCLSALEAMAYGKPVVRFDLERLGWIDRACGPAVAPFDVDALRAAVDTLAVNPVRRHEMGRAARACSTEFGWDAAAERYAAVVHSIAGSADPVGNVRIP
ncbi:glycosyltransferase involved in cell wall biosynthesis [Pseudonocardia kunmingensis]|uniref:Glycosyltransferase involved in cell wall biosynthesis n=1 Tax=Pseudonocardia kunmingensis TaxID=630975 RepID=A0A543DKJ3_9PSEU|nr:glycosyltransferase involved in cell wall biosynthesis [Pseudonocardia kunmingensis]